MGPGSVGPGSLNGGDADLGAVGKRSRRTQVDSRRDFLDRVVELEFNLKNVKVGTQYATKESNTSATWVLLKPDAFEQLHLHLTYPGIKLGGEPKSFITQWMKLYQCHDDSDIPPGATETLRGSRLYRKRVYLTAAILPGAAPADDDESEQVLNLWTGFAADQLDPSMLQLGTSDGQQFAINALMRVLEAIHDIAGRDARCAHLLLKWCAHLVRFADTKPQLMPCLYGGKGCGKSSFLQFIGKIVGEKRVFTTADPKRDIFNQFNAALAGKLLVILEELSSKTTQSPDVEGQLKALVTEDSMVIARKQVDVEDSVPSCLRLVACTNHAAVLPAERRYPEFECSASRRVLPPEECSRCSSHAQCNMCRDNALYWDEQIPMYNDKRAQLLFYKFLKGMPIDVPRVFRASSLVMTSKRAQTAVSSSSNLLYFLETCAEVCPLPRILGEICIVLTHYPFRFSIFALFNLAWSILRCYGLLPETSSTHRKVSTPQTLCGPRGKTESKTTCSATRHAPGASDTSSDY